MTAAYSTPRESTPARRTACWPWPKGRAVFELAAFYATRHLLAALPKGDGHPVLVLPGFLASDSSTVPMRRLLKDLGYDTYGWELGRNVRVDTQRVRDMEAQLLRIHARDRPARFRSSAGAWAVSSRANWPRCTPKRCVR